MIPRTKLVCTIGPASIGRVDALVASGMSIARVNLAHGTVEEHAASVRAVRAAAERAGRDLGVLADLPGPKIRLGGLRDDEVTLVAGQGFRIGPDERGDASGATASHPLAAELRPGDRVLLADGAAELRVTGTDGKTLDTLVERGGTVRSRAGVAVPADRLSLPALTAEDRATLPRLIELGVDFVGLSFVRRAADVVALRDVLAELSPVAAPAIVAKIETRPAVDAAEAILDVADALMVARGDLGVELPFEAVPLLQKRLVRLALAAERPVIVATQMLESMTAAPRPTRAEASDVANAALDGADAVMLSGETAIGAYPVEAADAAIRILRAVDDALPYADPPAAAGGGPLAPARHVAVSASALASMPGHGHEVAHAVALAAVELASESRDVTRLACFTRTGRTALLLAALRPRVGIVAFSPDVGVRRRLALAHGVEPRAIASLADDEVSSGLAAAVRAMEPRPEGAVVLVSTTAGEGPGPNLVEVLGG